MRKIPLTLLSAAVIFLLPGPAQGAITSGMDAHIVLGQPDFESGDVNMGQGVEGVNERGLYEPHDVAVCPVTNRLYIADKKNNRIIWFNDIYKLVNGGEADGVLGQQNLKSSNPSCTADGLNYPNGLAVDEYGNLYVCDQGNNRVLRYDYPITSGESASLVVGQPNFESNNYGTAADMLCWPSDLAVDDEGNLYVVEPVSQGDEGNSRVLIFAAPLSTGMPASIVLGQPDFTTVNYECSSSGLYGPRSVAVDS